MAQAFYIFISALVRLFLTARRNGTAEVKPHHATEEPQGIMPAVSKILLWGNTSPTNVNLEHSPA